ncbi:MAG: threonine--tRNA ligase [bacterium]
MPVILEEDDHEAPVYRVRHSLSHVLAQAVQKLFPGTLLGFGPPIDDGFYYDFVLPRPIADGDLTVIEAEMRRIIDEGQDFTSEDLTAEEAFARIDQMGEPHKREYAEELVSKRGLAGLRFYTNGPFLDMCEGPHVENTKELKRAGFKLHSIAGAYWRGDERNQQMTRIYGYAYLDQKALKARIQAVEEAKKRDHRKLGQELGLFAISEEVGKGLPLWLPAGTVLRDELEKLAYEMEFKYGYQRVSTPQITRSALYYTSGHLPLYEAVMYPPMKLDEEAAQGGEVKGKDDAELERYYLRPMNCPHHHMVFGARKRSYRDLPLRLAEYGTVYRFERAGALHGLSRVRGMTMNDAHLYMTPEQLKDEFKSVMRLHKEYYDLFGFENYYLRLSLWDPEDSKRAGKYVDDPAAWADTERRMREALDEMGLWYKIAPGEAAFYGPKVDFQFLTVGGKEFTVSTNQIDFAVPGRFGLTYTDRDGQEKTPYCIHRAPLGTHERFISFLIEHYGGAFPTWLAPEQVRVVPVSEKFNDYAAKVERILRERFIRATVDDSDHTMGKKIRSGVTAKVPMLLVVGAQEEETGTVTCRRYGVQAQTSMDLAAFVELISAEIKERRHVTA